MDFCDQRRGHTTMGQADDGMWDCWLGATRVGTLTLVVS